MDTVARLQRRQTKTIVALNKLQGQSTVQAPIIAQKLESVLK